MRRTRLASALALAFFAAACGLGDSENVMAQRANALTPEQVDAALGPELANVVDNGAAPDNMTVAPPATEPAESSPPADEAPVSRRAAEPEPEVAPDNAPAEEPPVENMTPEE